MRTDPLRTRILHLVRKAARWRPRNNPQIWLSVPPSPVTASPPTSSAWLRPARRSVRSGATGNWLAWSWRRPRPLSKAS